MERILIKLHHWLVDYRIKLLRCRIAKIEAWSTYGIQDIQRIQASYIADLNVAVDRLEATK